MLKRLLEVSGVYDNAQFDFGFKMRYVVIDILAGNFSILFGRKRCKFFMKSAEKLVTLNKICLNCVKKFDKIIKLKLFLVEIPLRCKIIMKIIIKPLVLFLLQMN